MTPQLCIEKVIVKRDRRVILRVDHLCIQQGEWISIVGPNGAGKTTLLKIICGLQKPDSGSVRIHGEKLAPTFFAPATHLRKLIGYVPQQTEYSADVPFTVREVIAMGRVGMRPLFSRLSPHDYLDADQWLKRMGMSAQCSQTFRTLSGGEQQKTLIARAMVSNPQILLLDEPTANLDRKWKCQLMEVLETIYRQMQVTILMVSHDLLLNMPVCAKVLMMEQGIICPADAENINSVIYPAGGQ